jgi:hypothetical protein
MARPDDVSRILLVATPGGHLMQLLAGEEVVMAQGPTHRNVTNMLRNLVLAWRIIRARNPE